MLPRLRAACVYYLFEAYLYAYLLLLRAGTHFRQTVVYRSSPAFRARAPQTGTVLLLGDATAEGVGDDLSRGGLAPRLTALLAEHRQTTGVRFMWEAVTAGRLLTTSEDWLPVPTHSSSSPSSSTATSSPAAPADNLFSRALVSGPFRRAEIVVVLAGAHDGAAPAAATARNVAAVADAAARLGKHVLVAGVPVFADPATPAAAAARARDDALRAAVAALAKVDYGPAASVSLGPDPQRVLVRGGDVVVAENEFVTFNGAGYRGYARELHDAVAPLAKRVEWAYWKQRI